jgi:type II secretory pathway component PulK
MNKARRHRRGFATVMALVLLSVIGITIAGMMTRIAMQSRRTTEESVRAQREQINIARSMGNSVTLPDELHSR